VLTLQKDKLSGEYFNQSERHLNLLTFTKDKMRTSWRSRSIHP